MRTKHFYLCLLLLVLGTANVWADKYYMPKSYKSGGNPRYTDLATMVGQRFMIYNTTINGGEDRTGFFYNDGVKIVRDKTKERDLYVYNEKYVFTLEAFDTDDDGTTDYYAIKSVTSDTYLDINGSTLHATPVPLYIKNWADAGTAGWARSGVNYENYQYNIIANEKIDNDVFIVSSSATHIADTKHYWNGTVAGFDIWSDGHPFAFYPANEVTSGDYLQDLHIFSRGDIYSAQVIWGCVQSDANITTSDAQTTSLLIDGDASTGISTAGNYIQFNLGDAAVQNIYIYLQRGDENYPTSVKIQAGNDESSIADVAGAEYETALADNQSFTQEIDLGAAYKYIRVVNTTANATAMALSEAYVLPKDPNTEDAVKYFDALETATYDIYGYASAQQYTTQVAEFNEEYSSAKLLSGVPLPGNKYRIYADAYVRDDEVFTNQEICLYDATKDTVHIKGQGAYAAADTDARKYYEWYCEQTADGKLVFRNVADPTKYLANNGKVSTSAYKWTFSTVETHRFGVPLKDVSGEYLAVINDGSAWEADVVAAQSQESPYTRTITTTADDGTETTTTESVDEGVCTDFVFIPVATTSEEKKITFTANELVKRNTTFTYNGEVYKLPFSKVFVSTDEMPTITINCNDRHAYIAGPDNLNSGIFVDGDKDDKRATYAEENQQLTFSFENINDNEILELKLQIVAPFEYGSGNLYLIRNMRKQATAMQAPVMRRSDTSVPVSPSDQVETQGAKMYYAKFDTRDTNMTLIESGETGETVSDYTGLDATSLFYFTKVADTEITEYYKAEIQSAITTRKCAAPDKWDAAGDVWYVQPNRVGDTTGYVIGLNQLNATNNPYDAWCSNHETDDIIVSDDANDPGALWEFVLVEDADAIPLLQTYISDKVTEIKETIIPGVANKDEDKAKKYELYAESLATSAENETDVATLVGLSHKAHMLEHEVTYALQPLPEYTVRDEKGSAGNYEQPNWYYLYNVKSMDSGEKHYAKFNTKDTYMNLAVADKDREGNDSLGLANMFFFEGKKVSAGTLSDDKTTLSGDYNTIDGNALTFDEYLQVDVHNFLAGEDTTLVSKNEEVYSATNVAPSESEGKQIIKTFTGDDILRGDEAWRITTEFYLDDVSYNAYGTCLLAASIDPLKNNYAGEFQMYLKDDRSLVIKVNNEFDTYRFWHTQDNYSEIKVVITYSWQKVQLDVYNAKGAKETITITGATLNDVEILTCAWPATGVDLFNINVERVKAMNWKVQDLSGGDNTTDETDTWYVLPSSNETYLGHAIVAGGANDTNFGWTNIEALNQTIFSDAGTHDNSTWQFVKVTEFDDHVDQLLEKYSTDNCVIYNEQLATLYRSIKKNASFIKALTDGATSSEGKSEEAYFNEIYDAVKSYTGPMPDELKAPKPGKFYTMRPAYEQSSTQLYASQLNRIVQKPDTINDEGEYDSSGVWLFEGTTAADGFYELDGIMLKSLHTQSYTNEFTADNALLDDASETAVTINPVGGCVVRFQGTDNNYLRRNAVGDSIMVGDADIIGNSHASLVFTRTGTAANTVSATVHNEFNEVMTADGSDVTGTLASVSVETNVDFKATATHITNGILCPDRNGNEIDTNGDIVLTFTYSNLPSTFTSFNNIGLDIHALTRDSKYQQNNDKKSRKFNVAVDVGADVNNLVSFGSLTEAEIAAGIGVSSQSVHKVWNVASDNAVTVENNSVVVRLTISTTDALCIGCFFGLSNIILSAEGDTWYIEEMPDTDKTKIYHKTKTNSVGVGSLMLGYNAIIPTNEVNAFYPVTNNDVTDKHITMRSYDGILPACTPAILHNVTANTSGTYKFYYTTDTPDEVSDKATESDGIVIDGALYKKLVKVEPYETLIGEQGNVYMYLTTKTQPKLYRVYENYNEDGTKTGNNHDGGWINVNANRVFLVVGGSKFTSNASPTSNASLSLGFDDGFTTGIEDIEDDYMSEGVDESVRGIFDLQGRRLSEITAPGIYIVDGNKVVVK